MIDDPGIAAIITAFRGEAHDLVQSLGEAVLELERAGSEAARHEAGMAAFRHAHGLKGAAASLGFGRLKTVIHALEDVLAGLRDGRLAPGSQVADVIFSALDRIDGVAARVQPDEETLEAEDERVIAALRGLLTNAPDAPPDREADAALAPSIDEGSTLAGMGRSALAGPEEDRGHGLIRISNDKLDRLISQIGELQTMRIKMDDLHRQVTSVEHELERLERPGLELPRQPLALLALGLEQDVVYLAKVLDGLRAELFGLRLVRADTLFPILRRAVRDVGRRRGIEVALSCEGGEHELDRKVVDALRMPLIHLVRNAVDHGIEPPEVRRAAGKPESASIRVRATHLGQTIRFEVEDDGGGVDLEAVHERAVALGFAGGAMATSPTEVLRLLFLPGLSTVQQADDVSGRGVGLDAVKQAVEALRGSIQIETWPGRGTRFRLTLPLTLATESGLLVRVDTERYIVPRTAVQRVLPCAAAQVVETQGVASLWVEGSAYPLARLEPGLRITRRPPDADERAQVLLLTSAEAIAAVVVDEVEGELEIVVRDLGTFIRRLPMVSGLTITVASEIVFVLNAADIVRTAVAPADALARSRSDRPGPKAAARPRGRARILVVDDSVTMRMLNQKMLAAEGYQVHLANDGLNALEVLRAEPCDLVLADVQMPRLDGFELTRRIKGDPALARTAVVLLTSLGSEEDRERGLVCGADAYLVKSRMTQAELVRTIEQLV